MIDGAMLASLPDWAFAFVLVLCRITAVMMFVPGIGETEMPMMVRAGLALAMTALVLPTVAAMVSTVPAGLAGAGMIATELLVGGVLGWLARLPAIALSMTGALVSTMTGLSSVVQPDPALGGQSSAMARLFGLLASVLILSTGLYALPLKALVGSYHLIPPGMAMPAGAMADSIVGGVSAALLLSVQLASPFLLVGLMLQAGLGLLARLVPQLQVFSIAAPGQILGGLLLLGIAALPLLTTWLAAVTEIWSLLPGH